MVHAGTSLIDPNKIFEKIHLAPGMRVADLGCGRTGHFVFSAAQAVGDKGVVYAVDVIKDVLASVKSLAQGEGFDNIQTVWSDIELAGRTPIPDESVDACFIVNVMFQLKNKAGAMREAARMLKKEGYLVVVDWMKKLGALGPAPEVMTSPQTLAASAEEAGLAPVENFPAGAYHYSLILKKI
jgi:ubiquinone/menaquinone biosynthesis C-methylase UbiE